MSTSYEQTAVQKAGWLIAIIGIIGCAMAMLTGGPDLDYYLIVAGCGLAGGFLAGKHRIVGAISGAVAAAGALFGIAFVAEHLGRLNKLVFLIGGGIGSLPGIGLYHVLVAIIRSAGPREDDLRQFDFGPKPGDR